MLPTPNDLNAKIALRMRTMRILWLALMISVVQFFVMFAVLTTRPADTKENNVLSLALVIVGMSMTIASILVRQKIVSQAIAQKSVAMVQQAYIVAWALCEASALMGLLDFFITANRFYYVPYVIALLGDLINFPRKGDVEAALF